MANENVMVKESKAKTLLIERNSFKSKEDGREMFSYAVKGKAYGRDIRVDFVAKDNGGYEVLDIMAFVSPTMNLVMRDEEMVDEKGKESKYTVYEAQVTDKDGNVLTCPLKPQRGSDKSLLNMLLVTM